MLNLSKRATGYLQIFGDKLVEADSCTCNHCNTIFFIKPFVDPKDSHGYCDVCDKLICPRCLNRARGNGAKCDPYDEWLARVERAFQLRKDAGLDQDVLIGLRK